MADVLKSLSMSRLKVLEPRSTNGVKNRPIRPPKPKEKTFKYKKGVCVWIHHPTEVWSQASIIKGPCNGGIVVECSDGKKEEVQMKDNYPLLCGVSSDWKQLEDLTCLNPLHEAAVLECLSRRCQANQYYTKAGITLVAINPFKDVEGLYDTNAIAQYRNKNPKEQPPHVFAVAQEAFTAMKRGIGYMNQSIVVSGESGAGKTWTARCLMKYLASVAVPFNPGGFKPSPADCIEKRILDSNPLLEAFGNAATARNLNSSRFGKYIQLQFDRGNHIVGASIQTYLLEKTRVVQQSGREHNFHIFYQLLLGSTTEEKERWGLTKSLSTDPLSFTYLPHSDTTILTDTDIPADLTITRNAMHNVGISDTKQQQVFKVLIGIIHLGNLCFQSDEDMDPCDISDSDSDCMHSLQFSSQLLGIDPKLLVKSVIFRQITASHNSRRKSVFMKPCTVKEANARRDCLAKLIYSRVFDWLVASVNSTTCAGKWHSFIGLLDIYGFESFNSNSLEQLCINYANEKLQQHFVTHFLRAEQEEYQAEGIPWNFCSFTDNRPCLDAIESKISVFTLMNEECNLNRQSNPVHFSQRVLDTMKKPYISHPHRSLKQPAFVIKHYAEPVTYHVQGLIEKNKDHIPIDLLELLSNSNNSFVTKLVKDMIDSQKHQKARKPTAKTVVTKFKLSLDSLMSTLNSTSPHYIRCIKSNRFSRPDVFDRQHVVSQLRACGVLETITISAAGFPTKIGYAEFWQRYRMMLKMDNGNARLSGTRRSYCADIIETVFGDEGKENHVKQALYGNTKIFLADGQLEQLECRRAEAIIESAKCIQRAWRHYLHRRNMAMMQWAATIIQAAFRGWKARCYVNNMHDAARVIQHAMLMYSIRKQQERQLSEQIVDQDDNCHNIGTDEYAAQDIGERNVPAAPNKRHSLVNGWPESNNDDAADTTSHKYVGKTVTHSNPIRVRMPGYSQPSVYSGIQVLQASSMQSHLTTAQPSEKCIDHALGYIEEEIDGIDEDDNQSNNDLPEGSDGTLTQVLKMPAVDVLLAGAVTVLLLKGPLTW